MQHKAFVLSVCLTCLVALPVHAQDESVMLTPEEAAALTPEEQQDFAKQGLLPPEFTPAQTKNTKKNTPALPNIYGESPAPQKSTASPESILPVQETGNAPAIQPVQTSTQTTSTTKAEEQTPKNFNPEWSPFYGLAPQYDRYKAKPAEKTNEPAPEQEIIPTGTGPQPGKTVIIAPRQ